MPVLQVYYEQRIVVMDGKHHVFAEPLPDIYNAPDKWRQSIQVIVYNGSKMTIERKSSAPEHVDTEYKPPAEAEVLLAPIIAMCVAKQKAEDEAKAAADAKVAEDAERSRQINERRAAQDEADHQERLRTERAAEDARRDAQIAVGGIPNAKE